MCLLAGSALNAQGEIEALRFGNLEPTGSARITGMAGAGSTLGADLSAANLNPGALAQLRRGELMITTRFNLHSIESQYIDGLRSSNFSQLQLHQLGAAFVSPRYVGYGRKRKPATSGLIHTNVAIGYQKLASYKRDVRAKGFNPFSSITDAFAENANGTFPEDLNDFSFSGLAWGTLAINNITGFDNQYFGSGVGGQVEQNIRIRETGNRSAAFASLGLNFDNKIFVGATLTGLSLNHSYRWSFTEEDVNNVHTFFQDNPQDPNFPLEFPMNSVLTTDDIETSGYGVSGNIGVVVSPTNSVRLGVSVQLPGVILNNEIYRREMQHSVTFVDQFGQDSIGTSSIATPEAENSYNLNTPYGFTVGGTYLFGKSGFITADVGVLDYSSTRLRSPYLEDDPFYYGYTEENERIGTIYQPAVNLRLGGEYRADLIRLRAGVAYEGSPLTTEARLYEDPENPGETLTADYSTLRFAAGLGVRGQKAFMDFAFQSSISKGKVSPYTTDAASGFDPTLLTSQATNQIVLTLGVKL